MISLRPLAGGRARISRTSPANNDPPIGARAADQYDPHHARHVVHGRSTNTTERPCEHRKRQLRASVRVLTRQTQNSTRLRCRLRPSSTVNDQDFYR